jgi:hypothetical protein
LILTPTLVCDCLNLSQLVLLVATSAYNMIGLYHENRMVRHHIIVSMSLGVSYLHIIALSPLLVGLYVSTKRTLFGLP